MNWNRITKWLPTLMIALGNAAAIVRVALYKLALDEKNLLTQGHALSVVVWLLFAAAVALVAVGVFAARRCWDEEDVHPSVTGAVGAWILAAAMGFSLCAQGIPVSMVEKLGSLTGLLCVPGLIYIGICRIRGKRPFFACHGLVCVYFCLYLVGMYGHWSANPQYQDYAFSMLACVAVGVFAYQQAALDVQMGNGKLQYAAGLLAGFLGLAALYSPDHPWLYLAGGIWAMTNLMSPPAEHRHRFEKRGG